MNWSLKLNEARSKRDKLISDLVALQQEISELELHELLDASITRKREMETVLDESIREAYSKHDAGDGTFARGRATSDYIEQVVEG